jgi:quercetin 2,3-dioxygenase
MLRILPADAGQTFEQGSFRIRRIRPGAILGSDGDLAFGPLSVIDHARLGVGTLVRMHEHKNDEILSYMWRGSMVHEDSTGQRIVVSPERLMMMNAGASFRHEESTPDGPVEMLQIFIRPRQADLPGVVQFHDRLAVRSEQWSLIGGPQESDAPLKIRQRVMVHDARLESGQAIVPLSAPGLTPWLYCMDGTVNVGQVRLEKGEAATDLDDPLPKVHAHADATLVLFLVDRLAQSSTAGTISGQ